MVTEDEKKPPLRKTNTARPGTAKTNGPPLQKAATMRRPPSGTRAGGVTGKSTLSSRVATNRAVGGETPSCDNAADFT